MAKKRLIFTLLYNDGAFMLSRNFRLQRAGDIQWLKSNYNFKKIAFSIDELVVLDVSRNQRDINKFCAHIKLIGEACFIPIAVGGGIMSQDQAKVLINSGADKLVINTALFQQPRFVKELISIYGSQCVIASIDVMKKDGQFECYIDNGSRKVRRGFLDCIKHITSLGVGEIYLNSIDKDGTGQGYMLDLLDRLSNMVEVPVIIAGGAGNWHHFLDGLQHHAIDAVATANLFNFIAEGFPNARIHLLNSKVNLARWDTKEFVDLEECLMRS